MEAASSHPAATRGFPARLPPAQDDRTGTVRKRHVAALPGLRRLERVLDACPMSASSPPSRSIAAEAATTIR